MGKYATLTDWLKKCGRDKIRITFDELNKITAIPPSAYRDRSAWANCTNGSPFQHGWLNAGYCVAGVNLKERWVDFAKAEIVINFNRHTKAATRIQKRAVPTTPEEELLLTVPDNLLELSKDEYYMVQLTKENSDIVEACIAVDPVYQSKGKAVMEHYFNAEDYSEQAYYEIIRCIATENSTRTSKKAMHCLAAYCADKDNRFLRRIEFGDSCVVDDLVQHIIDNGHNNVKSLASKVCRYLNEWLYNGCAFTINDSVVRGVLPYYLAYYNVDRKIWQGKRFEELSYIEFYSVFSAVRDAAGVLNNHQLDHLIWYAYKNDSIRSELAKALAKIL